jgi:hypothetical protein
MPISSEEYAKHIKDNKRACCPNCKSNDVFTPECFNPWEDEKVYCNSCGASWVEITKVIGYSDLEEKS